jgi:alkylation response protein AidB-like acyl-CoA dehydrogenase
MIATERRAAPALTQLNEEETMFEATVRKFARERIAPYVREMDDAGVFHELLPTVRQNPVCCQSRSRTLRRLRTSGL